MRLPLTYLTRYLARFVGLCLVVAMMAVRPASAGFENAVAAFDAGDYETAAAEWRSLAHQCDARAQTALAGLYRSGLGAPHSPVEAIRWYLTAAWAGERYAQQIVGDAYAVGDVLPADSVKAAFWLTLAARNGLEWAARRRAEIVATLSETRLARVERRLARFRLTDAAACRAARTATDHGG